MRSRLAIIPLAAVALFLGRAASPARNTRRPSGSDWPMFNHDLAGTRYSPLAQITAGNVSKLTEAWTFHLHQPGNAAAKMPSSEATPIVVNDVMYLPAGDSVVALEPETGREIWRYKVTNGLPSRRGVSYWPGDKDNPPRIIVTAGRRMIGLDARTGKIDPGFGNEGVVDLVVAYQSPPTIYKNLIFVGANVASEAEGIGEPGDTRAYDARTGTKIWDFHSVPQPGEVGHESWEGDGWKERSGIHNWGFSMTVDTARNLVYTIFASPAYDYWGGDRKGNDLFGNSVVALDANTGKMKWYFQLVHHDLWDFDLPPAPVLLDVEIDHKKVPVLAQAGKVGYMFILNRVTGESIFGFKETPVPQSQVPGEQTAPTQPIPLKPPPFGRMSFSIKDLVTAKDTTEEHAKACREFAEKSGGLISAGPFTPWVYHEAGAPTASTVVFPGPIGGSDWGGSAADPKLGYVFVSTNDYGDVGWVERAKPGARIPYQAGSFLGRGTTRFRETVRDANGVVNEELSWPCQKPPWGRLTAVNAATGEFAWQVPLGVTDELPEGQKNTGRRSTGGPIATAGGLVFIGATNDHRFRAFDSRTGKELWETKFTSGAESVPITYLGKNGKQYVAVVTSMGHPGITSRSSPDNEALHVFALP
ncbi:MAG TPA: PQQ-binding-like beta-propeller repeat protein [Bryobacteraceae bacterium]|nr:PQQ-binding-like beta-propeller repeat protein [Bryobacteraceae bacterium]